MVKDHVPHYRYPKSRTGKECKKILCERYKDYMAWQPGTPSLKFCMECKNAYRSQFNREEPRGKI